MQFLFGEFPTNVNISHDFKEIENYFNDLPSSIIIADTNTGLFAEKINEKYNFPLCILESGEENKNWHSVEKILTCAHNAKLGRDGLFIAIGGGVIGDLAGFAASIYKRGCRFFLISTTLLGMVDASVGGKTGFDLLEIKNLAGTFYPAENVFMPLCTLSTLPQIEWKSGMAELIKHTILSENCDLFDLFADNIEKLIEFKIENIDLLYKLIEKSVLYKGSIVSEDPKETGTKRILLNLGHTFGHALESACGFGNISHGEAVAWGIARACELGLVFGKTPKERAVKIIELLKKFGYNCDCPHPLANDAQAALRTSGSTRRIESNSLSSPTEGRHANTLFKAMTNDKKNKSGAIRFIVPGENSAVPISLDSEKYKNTILAILKGEVKL